MLLISFSCIAIIILIAVKMTVFSALRAKPAAPEKFALHADPNNLPPHKIAYEVFPPATGWHNVLILKEPHDGDTVTVGVLIPVVVRLAKLNAPELNTPEGKLSQKALAERLQVSKLYRVWMSGREKYGRTLAEIYDDSGASVNRWMIDNGFAKVWDGKGERQ